MLKTYFLDSGKLFYLPRAKEISKQIRSPNFPRPYPHNVKCLWMFVRGSGLLLSADITINSISTAGPKDKLIIQEPIVRSRSNRGVHTFYGNKTGKIFGKIEKYWCCDGFKLDEEGKRLRTGRVWSPPSNPTCKGSLFI